MGRRNGLLSWTMTTEKGAKEMEDTEAMDFRLGKEFKALTAEIIKRMPPKRLLSTREIKDRIPKNSPVRHKMNWFGDALEWLILDGKLEWHQGVIIDKYKKTC